MRHKLLNGDYLKITDKMDGKMMGMWSINTSPSINPFCQKMQSCKSLICSHCFSRVSEARWKGAREAWQHNYHVLSNYRLVGPDIPILNRAIFRFQAHGDLANRQHYLNLVAIAKANPQTTFTIWTKNLAVINDGGIIKLDNLIHVYSSPKLNDLHPAIPEGFNKVFTVYTRPFVREHPVAINCGDKHCNECRLCYTHNRIRRINELIKAPASRKR